MDSKDKVLAEALNLLDEIGFNTLQHDHTCFDEEDEDYQCYCGVEEILDKIAKLNQRARLLQAKSETSS